MNRYPLNYRSSFFNTGMLCEPTMIFRKPVIAGESAEIDIQSFYESPPVELLRNPAVLSLYCFYVPNRLVWPQWQEFLSDPDTSRTVPTTTTGWANIFEPGTQSKQVFARRAYKAIYNAFFGDQSVGQTGFAWYDDIGADTVVTMRRMKTVSQVVQQMLSDLDTPADNFTGTVSGAVATIELNELDRRMRARKANVSQRFSGDKYVDALGRFGVKVSDALIANPEMLGFHSEVIYPQNTVASSGGTSVPTVGTRYGKYAGTVKHKIGKKFFQEHGYVIGILALRPVLSYSQMQCPPEAFMVDRSDYVVDPNLQPYAEYPREFFSTAGDPDPVMMRGFQYLYGQAMWGNTVRGVLNTTAQTINDMRYPSINPMVTGLQDLELTTHVKFKGATPINARLRA